MREWVRGDGGIEGEASEKETRSGEKDGRIKERESERASEERGMSVIRALVRQRRDE